MCARTVTQRVAEKTRLFCLESEIFSCLVESEIFVTPIFVAFDVVQRARYLGQSMKFERIEATPEVTWDQTRVFPRKHDIRDVHERDICAVDEHGTPVGGPELSER